MKEETKGKIKALFQDGILTEEEFKHAYGEDKLSELKQ